MMLPSADCFLVFSGQTYRHAHYFHKYFCLPNMGSTLGADDHGEEPNDGKDSCHVEPSDGIERFKLYRDYVKHQYDLINHRTSWYVALQAFLFATFGFTIQKKVEVVSSLQGSDMAKACRAHLILCQNAADLDVALIAFCTVGLLASLVFIAVLSAASGPIRHLYDLWDRYKSESKLADKYLPNLTGGTSKVFATLGPSLTMTLPSLMAVAWLAILIVVEFMPWVRDSSFLVYLFAAPPRRPSIATEAMSYIFAFYDLA